MKTERIKELREAANVNVLDIKIVPSDVLNECLDEIERLRKFLLSLHEWASHADCECDRYDDDSLCNVCRISRKLIELIGEDADALK